MVDCTRTANRALRARLVAVFAAILELGSGLLAGSARADGDPASDILATQALFLPQDAGASARQQAQLGVLIAAAHRSGYEIRVAMIASPADLGSVTELWQQPESYARFLGQELSLVYRGRLLVVMPAGYGLYRFAGRLSPEQSTLAGARPPRAALGRATLAAIQHLAAASGYTVTVPSAVASATSSSTDTLSWLVLATGGALIVLAWTASLRARPVQIRRGARTPTS
jgi:hypothetical protein